jgi:ribosomal protein L37AE/L43A
MTNLKICKCESCGSHKVRFDSVFGYYQCEKCGVVWALDKDDPDYDRTDYNA